MFIEKRQLLIFLNIGRMDWGAGHLTILIGTGGRVFANKIARRTGHFSIFSGFAGGDARGWN